MKLSAGRSVFNTRRYVWRSIGDTGSLVATSACSRGPFLCVRVWSSADLYVVIDPDKIWIIPADVEPIAVGDHPVTYTHYDPKTKRETVHFYPQRQ